jgi:formylmethanofuran dehydrogenase subunit E
MLQKALNFHGHKCVGLVLGTRIAIAGLEKLEINDPANARDLIVYVEIDRCLADAIQATTGCTIGHRKLKHVDYGKFAATFVDTSKNKAVRVSAREEARQLVNKYSQTQTASDDSHSTSEKEEMDQMIEAYSKMPDSELLNIREVSVTVPRLDLPGKPQRKEICSVCGEHIFDGREVTVKGSVMCRSCAKGSYYTILPLEIQSES